MSEALKTLGKSALIVIGAGFGLLRGLRAIGNITQNTAGLEMLEARVDTIHLAVARLADQAEKLQSRQEQTITRDELAQTLDRVFGRLEQGVDERFEHQTRSVEALRTMVAQTDELLQRVLDGLESMTAEDEHSMEQGGHGREWDLSRATS